MKTNSAAAVAAATNSVVVDGTKIVNLTEHKIDIKLSSEDVLNNTIVQLVTVPGIEKALVCRCVENPPKLVRKIGGIKVVEKSFGDIENLPDPQPNTVYLVSLPVASKLNGTRNDVLAVGRVIRDTNGQPLYTEELSLVR